MNFDDAGLAPQHTLYAYTCLLNGSDVFPYQFAPGSAARRQRPVDPARAKAVADFFAWVEQDSTLQAMARAADSIVAHANGDSIASFPIAAIDADGLPLPLTSSVVRPAAPAAALLGAPSPNPFASRTELGFTAPAEGRVRIAVFDAEGRRVALLADGDVRAGLHAVAWDGRDDGGRAMPAGVYLVRLAGFGRSEARRVALTR